MAFQASTISIFQLGSPSSGGLTHMHARTSMCASRTHRLFSGSRSTSYAFCASVNLLAASGLSYECIHASGLHMG